MTKLFALIDANNFYASCERVFNPSLIGKPLVTLSSNDGCVIARSNEAKALGIKMGEPFFKIKELVQTHNVKAVSSNFGLYGDMSRRMMSILEEFSPNTEIYSIDECFLDFSHLDPKEILARSTVIRNKVQKWLGLPISIGVGATKTLAKLANHLAKKRSDGVYYMDSEMQRIEALQKTSVADIWGIGRAYSTKLKTLGINSAFDFVNAPNAVIKKTTNILGLKTAYELRGISCIDLEDEIEPKQSITVSRSFGSEIKDYNTLNQAIAYFAGIALEKLRKSGQVTKVISIFIRTNPFARNSEQYSNLATLELDYPTDSTPMILSHIEKALSAIYKNSYSYKKVGIILSDLSQRKKGAHDLFDKPQERAKESGLMNVIDRLNNRYGRRTLFYASSGTSQAWLPKSNMRSGGYTAKWNDIVRVN